MREQEADLKGLILAGWGGRCQTWVCCIRAVHGVKVAVGVFP
ncbi:MAG: hypothetical protein QOF46_116 [Paraburkholderia sp.]|nr:hypothetical protein [Paraburkholderia sp.]